MVEYSVLLLICLSFVFVNSSPLSNLNVKDWDYIMLSYNYSSTNENLIKTNLRPVRISAGVYGLNGTITVGLDVPEEFEVEVNLMRNPSGDSHYTMYPFRIPKSSVPDFMNGPYRQFVMDDLRKCSNMPIFGVTWQPPFPKGLYELKKCTLNTDALPNHMPEGYYKVILTVTGPSVKFVGYVVIKVSPIRVG